MFPTITIPKLHLEYRNWIAELNFCKEEITRFEHYLEDVVNKTDDVVVKAEVEHFQNQFIRQKEVIEELKHKLHISESQLAGFVKGLPGLGLESIQMDNHTRLRDEGRTFRKIYTELKVGFRRFEAENL
jgi:3-deoxy-D-arabino-heptulosonate 7-phosphate (DAHP) synthase